VTYYVSSGPGCKSLTLLVSRPVNTYVILLVELFQGYSDMKSFGLSHEDAQNKDDLY